MKIFNRLAKIVCIGIIGFVFVSCGEDGESSKVDVVMVPDRPLVSQANFTIVEPDGDVVEIKGPWFGIQYNITNGSTQRLIVQDFQLEVTASSNGSTNKKVYFPDFGLFSSNRFRITTDPIAAGDTFREQVTWPVESLPALKSFRYRCKITFYGYFILEDDPETEDVDEEGLPGARFERSISFQTR